MKNIFQTDINWPRVIGWVVVALWIIIDIVAPIEAGSFGIYGIILILLSENTERDSE